jgi:hypothetical protein
MWRMLVAILLLSMSVGIVTAKATLSIILALMHRSIRTEVASTVVPNQRPFEHQALHSTAPAA